MEESQEESRLTLSSEKNFFLLGKLQGLNIKLRKVLEVNILKFDEGSFSFYAENKFKSFATENRFTTKRADEIK